MDAEEAKKFVIGTCETPFMMDMHDLKAGLSKWGFKVDDYEILTDPSDLEVLPLYLVWLECDYRYNLARENVRNWLHDMREFPWTGSWTFVLRFWHTPSVTKEFEFRVTKYLGNVWKISGLSEAKPRWPTTRFTRIRGEIYSVDEVHGLAKEELNQMPPGAYIVIEENL